MISAELYDDGCGAYIVDNKVKVRLGMAVEEGLF